jgi:hypothetical protein
VVKRSQVNYRSAKDSTLVNDHEQTIADWQYRLYRASGACDFPGRFAKIADNQIFDQRGQWRGANLWCYQVMAPASGHRSATTRITVSAFSSERPDRLNGRPHQ